MHYYIWLTILMQIGIAEWLEHALFIMNRLRVEETAVDSNSSLSSVVQSVMSVF